MATNSFDIKTFCSNDDAVAALVDPADLFGFWNRSYRVPAGQCALVVRKSGERVVFPAGSDLSSDDVAEVIWCRTGTVTLKFANVAIHSIDHYLCRAEVDIRVHLIADAAEMVAFRNRVIGSSNAADRGSILDYFHPHVVSGLTGAADGRGVGALIDSENRKTIAAELFESLKASAFAAGVQIESPIHVRLDAPMYRQTQRAQADRKRRRDDVSAKQRIEQACALAKQEQTERVQQTLQRLRERVESSPSDSLATMIREFDETQRGPLYEGLFATCDDLLETDRIVVGSGDELLSFDPATLDAPQMRTQVPGDVGSIRSVQAYLDANGVQRLCIGAAVGVYEVSADLDDQVVSYRVENVGDVRGGVNSVALAGERLLATHSELGLLVWDRGSDTPARSLHRELTELAKAVRCVQFHPTGVYFSADHVVYRMISADESAKPERYLGSRSIISAICVTDQNVFAGNADGEVIVWSHESPNEPEIIHNGRQRACESVFMIELGGIERLFYTDTSSAVFARIVGDSFISRFEAGGQTLRRVEVATDLVVATNEARDRLFLWKPSTPNTPTAVIPIAQLTTRSIQDVCLVSTPA